MLRKCSDILPALREPCKTFAAQCLMCTANKNTIPMSALKALREGIRIRKMCRMLLNGSFRYVPKDTVLALDNFEILCMNPIPAILSGGDDFSAFIDAHAHGKVPNALDVPVHADSRF